MTAVKSHAVKKSVLYGLFQKQNFQMNVIIFLEKGVEIRTCPPSQILIF